MLSIVDKKSQKNEKLIIDELLASIDYKKSLIFNAGAGAGKTYALVESLKYICRDKAELLKYHNQKAICITYTNVAANEIKKRLGNTDLVLISTIHERLWDFIKEYQDELLIIHLDTLKNQLDILQQEIEENVVYSKLTKDQKEEITIQLFEHQKEFYEIYDSKAEEFRSKFKSIFSDFNSEIKNVTEFRKTCSKIIKRRKYEQCILAIKNAEKGYTEVKYDARNNKDFLHHMKISHDTLLRYSNQIISKYDELKRVIVDKYPYIFIDEYQDTSELVVNILTEIAKYSNNISHPVFVGYFGDYAQNIYDEGIGIKIEEYCKDYKYINKKYNYRSCSEIISLSNKIRNDNLKQQSVYLDSYGGSIKTYYGTEEDIDEFIRVNSAELKGISTEDKTTHCFLLFNKIVAEHSGLKELYDWFNSTPYYKREFHLLATELLNNDINKLGEIERYIYNIIEFYYMSQKDDTPLLDIFSKELFSSLDIQSVTKIIEDLKNMKGSSLKEIITSIEKFKSKICYDLQDKKDKIIINRSIDTIIGMDDFSMKSFVDNIKQALFKDDVNCEEQIEHLLNMDKDIFFRWFHYISRDYEDDIVYHTFHSTKGLEYDNVIIVFGDAFGRSKSFFNNYFNGYNCELKDKELESYRKARNLLYVAVTRACMNLRILYTGDYLSKKEIIDSIFGEVHLWEKKMI